MRYSTTRLERHDASIGAACGAHGAARAAHDARGERGHGAVGDAGERAGGAAVRGEGAGAGRAARAVRLGAALPGHAGAVGGDPVLRAGCAPEPRRERKSARARGRGVSFH